MPTIHSRILACTLLVLLAACGSGRGRDDGRGDGTGTTGGTSGGGTTACTPNAAVACTCADGTASTALCAADGSRVGVCQCGTGGTGGTGGTCSIGATQACTCSDGAAGTATCLLGAWSPCVCAGPASCTTSPVAQGHVSVNGIDVPFASGAYGSDVGYRMGDGCITHANYTFSNAGGCRLSLGFGAADGTDGGLVSASWIVDSACGGLGSNLRGTWQLPDGYSPQWPVWLSGVEDPSAASSCTPGAAENLEVTLPLVRTTDHAQMTITTSLRLSGDQPATAESASCVEAVCGGSYHEANGFCVRGCGPGLHDGGDGACVSTGTCSPGYAVQPNGTCAAGPDCSSSGPAASVAAASSVNVGATVALDGSGSSGNGLSYAWALHRPDGTNASLAPAARVTFVANESGTYVATLTVTDANGCSDAASASIYAGQSGGTGGTGGTGGGGHTVMLELHWKAPNGANIGDVDLHMLGPPPGGVAATWFDGAPNPFGNIGIPGLGGGNGTDCFFGNTNPDWGGQHTTAADNITTDDPAYVKPPTNWGGVNQAEVINLPAWDGSFRVAAEYWCSRVQGTDASGNAVYSTVSSGPVVATLNVYWDGTLKRTLTSPQIVQRDLWEGALVTISGGGTSVSVTPVGALTHATPDPTSVSILGGAVAAGCTADTN